MVSVAVGAALVRLLCSKCASLGASRESHEEPRSRHAVCASIGNVIACAICPSKERQEQVNLTRRLKEHLDNR